MQKYEKFLGLGIAGNFALHLAQAGELEDFKNVITKDEAAPKGIFPFYLPHDVHSARDILSINPLSHDIIAHPDSTLNIQAEPEVALICNLEFSDGKLIHIKPTHFGAYNDCSIRIAGANKISDKKNWGSNSKGITNTLIEIDKFSSEGVMDSYSIVSFLKRENEVHQYGEDISLTGYSYFYEELEEWIVNQINTQEDFGPLEHIKKYAHECGYPNKAILSIGATRYTEYGENTFLQKGDEVIVIVYDHTQTNANEILNNLEDNNFHSNSASVLHQKVI